MRWLGAVGRFLREQTIEVGKLLVSAGAAAMLTWWGAVSASASSSHPLGLGAPVFVIGALAALLGVALWIVGHAIKPRPVPTEPEGVHSKLDAQQDQLARIEGLLSRPPQWGATGPQGPLNPERNKSWTGAAANPHAHFDVSLGAPVRPAGAVAEAHADVSFGGSPPPLTPPLLDDKSDDDPQTDQ